MPPAVATISGFIVPDGDSFPKTNGVRKMARAVATVSGFLIPDGDSFPKTTTGAAAHKMARRAVETESGFIIPDGDSFPTTTSTHSSSSVTPPHNVASAIQSASTTGLSAPGTSVVPSSSSAFTTHTTTSVTSQEPVVQGNVDLVPRSAVIAILVLSALALLGGAFFLVRFYFIRRRSSKITPARARARASQGQVVISDPVNFQHVSSADGNNPPLWNTSDKVSTILGTGEIPDGKGGSHDHVQNVQFARNPRQDSF